MNQHEPSTRKGAQHFDRRRGTPLAEALAALVTTANGAISWRENRDPYRVGASEIMLQQTRVAAPWLEPSRRFLRRFPR